MYWRDIYESEARQHWLGLELAVDEHRPGMRVQGATPRSLRLSVGSKPLLWARQARYHEGLWWILARSPESPLPPITMSRIRTIKAEPRSPEWLAQWARYFARALEAPPCSPLSAGVWWLARDLSCEKRPLLESHPRWLFRAPELTSYPRQRDHGFEPWGSGELLALRTAETTSAARVKAWRKRQRDGTLPPILLWWVVPFDMFVLLDGHARLLASLEEGGRPAALLLHNVRVSAGWANAPMQNALLRLASTPEHSDQKQAVSVARMNELAFEAWGGQVLPSRVTPQVLRSRVVCGLGPAKFVNVSKTS